MEDHGSDADWYRAALQDKSIKPCIPDRKFRGKPDEDDKRRYERRNRIDISCGKPEDWHRVATRYDRCPKVLLSAIALATTVIFRRRKLTSLEPKLPPLHRLWLCRAARRP